MSTITEGTQSPRATRPIVKAWESAPIGLDGHRWPCPAAERRGAECGDDGCQPTDCPTWCTSQDHRDTPYHHSHDQALIGAGVVQSSPHIVTVRTGHDPITDNEPLIELGVGAGVVLLSATGALRLARMLTTAADGVAA